MTVTTSSATDSRTRRSPRLMSRLAVGALAAGSLVSGLAYPAVAEPGPIPTVGAVAVDVGVNTATVQSWVVDSGAVWADLAFQSSASHAVVQLSTSAPKMIDGKPSLGAAQPVALAGQRVSGNISALATASTYRFTLSPDGLRPDTTYHVLVTLPGKAGQEANVVAKSFKTKHRIVTTTVEWIHVSDDADPGLVRGPGEVRFGVRVAPDESKLASRSFSNWTGTMSLATGEDKVFSGGTFTAQADTRNSHAYVQVQGQEEDGVGFCPIGTVDTPTQGSSKCGDQAWAEAWVDLPSVRAEGELDTRVLAVVIGSPALQFQAQVRVQTKTS